MQGRADCWEDTVLFVWGTGGQQGLAQSLFAPNIPVDILMHTVA